MSFEVKAEDKSLAPGDAVNLEVDVLAKYVERLLPSTMGR